jgi:hypothetical protein
VARTVENALRVRSAPGTGADSRRLEPLLPAGTWLSVVEGPVAASGYQWHLVVPIASAELPSGWVAAGARDGTPWVVAAAYPCPAVPTTMDALIALAPNVGLACFAGRPLTVPARIVECNCDVDGAPEYDPAWFGEGAGPLLLIPPSSDRPPSDPTGWFPLALDPNATHPDPLPVGRPQGSTWTQADLVTVTGVFDHPAAATCTVRTWPYDEHLPVPTTACRSAFAVTAVTIRGGW